MCLGCGVNWIRVTCPAEVLAGFCFFFVFFFSCSFYIVCIVFLLVLSSSFLRSNSTTTNSKEVLALNGLLDKRRDHSVSAHYPPPPGFQHVLFLFFVFCYSSSLLLPSSSRGSFSRPTIFWNSSITSPPVSNVSSSCLFYVFCSFFLVTFTFAQRYSGTAASQSQTFSPGFQRIFYLSCLLLFFSVVFFVVTLTFQL